jgi:hypothetical protein
MPTILSPEGAIRASAKSLAARRQSLDGARISILDNSKANAGALLGRLLDLLVQRFAAQPGIVVRKGSAGAPATPELLERLRAASDLVLTGSADCGSCTSASVQDTTALEELGVPTILVGTDLFRPLALQLAGWLNLPTIQSAVTSHPLGGVSDDELDAKAADLVDELARIAVVAACRPARLSARSDASPGRWLW